MRHGEAGGAGRVRCGFEHLRGGAGSGCERRIQGGFGFEDTRPVAIPTCTINNSKTHIYG